MIKHFIAASVVAFGLAGSAAAQTTLDGLVNDLGTSESSDAVLPTPGEGGAGLNGPMDLADLYIADNGVTVAFGLTIATDIGLNNWGKYKIFIRTDNGGASGGTTDPWGRAIAVGDLDPGLGVATGAHYALSCWVDGGGGFNYHKWNSGTSSWDLLGSGATFAFNANGNAGRGGVEFWLTRASLGNPATVFAQATCTGGGGSDNGQDAVPTQANATDWGTVTTLNNGVGPVTVPVSMSEFAVE